ncbi:sensor histidine kinase [Rhodococcoides kyotonense]|uniref:histidine kinase n=1 Tax=Rhodococcoides kyotonense TaxID=398843 RepID=A0A239DY27_9NOCA|nr:ATP-binding protein [Rhodococcus kyotonensis]SNS37247.1 Sensor histidine kinase regulating citrate/malate metabolism [Rhodococcus kyotonensis]
MRRTTLAAQLLRLQLLIVVVVLVAIGGLSLAQSSAAFQRDAGRRAQSAAETLAANPVVRQLLPSAQPRIRTGLQSAVESVRAVSGLDYAQLADVDGFVILSTVPEQVGSTTRSAADGSGVGLTDTTFGKAVEANVPVLDDAGTLVGTAVVGDRYPSALDRFLQAAPNLLVYLAAASVLGGVGSVLLARRVKRQTLGMEASEILDLVGQREAMLRGLKEGVIALDPAGRVLLMSESAHEMLHISHGSKGRTVDELGVTDRLRDVLLGTASAPDEIVLVGDRVLVLNTVPIVLRGKAVGTVTTFRDRTELTDVEEELGVTKTSSTALREHIHEFDNQLHTISGLVQLQEYDEVVRYVDGLTARREGATSVVTDSVSDVGVAALLIAKIGAAAHRSVSVEIVPGSSLRHHDGTVSRDLCTVLGNLVDNAVAACSGRVLISLRENGSIEIEVRDDGPGVPNSDSIFEQGWSTRGSANTGHGFGLALVRLVCRRRHGDVSVLSDDGWTVFRAVLEERE